MQYKFIYALQKKTREGERLLQLKTRSHMNVVRDIYLPFSPLLDYNSRPSTIQWLLKYKYLVTILRIITVTYYMWLLHQLYAENESTSQTCVYVKSLRVQ
jgi:hypothetical protein